MSEVIMAKNTFTDVEIKSWDSIYGESRGPTSGRVKIIVEEFTRLGLVPAMMRVDDDMLPYDPTRFRSALQEAMDTKEDDKVQVYYHPVECEAVVGSTATTWSQWGRLILEVTGLLDDGAADDPQVKENVPRLQIPVTVRDAIADRGHTVGSVGTLVSIRVVAFFIAAQYGAWGTPTEVQQVTPFKTVLRKLGFVVRDCDIRRGTGIEFLLDNSSEPATRQEPNGPVVSVPTTRFEIVSAPEISRDLVKEHLFGTTVQDIDSDIAALEAKLAELKLRKEAAQVEAFRRVYLDAKVSDAEVSPAGDLVMLTIQLQSGEFLHLYPVRTLIAPGFPD